MAVAIYTKRWSMKPPLGAQINWGHPLGAALSFLWLCNESGSTAYDLAGNQHGVLGGATPPTRGIVSEYGLVFPSGTASVEFPLGIINTLLNSTSWSMSVRFSPNGGGYKQSQFGSPGSASSRQLAYSWQTPDKVSVGDEGNAFIITSGSSITAGKIHEALWTVSGSSHALYLNGKSEGTASYTFGSSFSGQYLLGDTAGSNSASGNIHQVRLFKRALGGDEGLELYADPYCFLQPQSPQRRYWIDAGVAGPDLSAVSQHRSQITRPRSFAPGLAR